MVPIWEDLSRKYSGTINIAALDGDSSYSIKERLGVSYFPTFLYFAENNKVYKFDGPRSTEALTEFLDNEQWVERIEEGEDIPREIDEFRRILRKIFQPLMVSVWLYACVDSGGDRGGVHCADQLHLRGGQEVRGREVRGGQEGQAGDHPQEAREDGERADAQDQAALMHSFVFL